MPKIFKDMSDKELDRLFKNAADQYEPPAAPEGAWDNFYNNYLHPEDDRKKPFFWYTPLVSFWSHYAHYIFSWRAVPVLGLALAILLWKQYNKKTDSFYIQQDAEQVKSTAPAIPGSRNNNTDSLYTFQPATPNPAMGQGTKKAFDKPGKQENTPTLLPSKVQQQLRTKQDVVQNQSFPIAATGNRDSLNNTTQQKNTDKTTTGKELLAQMEKPVNHATEPASKQHTAPPQTELTNPAQENMPGEDSFSSQKKKQKRPVYLRSKWNIGLAVGTNASITGGTLSSGLGLNTGLMVQRRFSDKSRFSAEAGIVRESMNYGLTRSSFRPDGWTVPNNVYNMGGKCTMVDIPVNIRYDFLRTKQADVFVSSGVSILWMTKQLYSYQNSNNLKITQDVTGRGNSLLTSINISAGYEKHIKSISLQFAPYVKIPAGKVGYGNISLGSIGAQISIKKNL